MAYCRYILTSTANDAGRTKRSSKHSRKVWTETVSAGLFRLKTNRVRLSIQDLWDSRRIGVIPLFPKLLQAGILSLKTIFNGIG